MHRFQFLSAVAASAVFVLCLVPSAQAASISFDLDFEFSGGTDPAGPGPWLNVTFDDSFGGTDTVRLTIDAAGLTGDESVAQIYLNFDPLLDPTQITFTAVDTFDSTPNSIDTGVNAYMADGDGNFDILFDMPPPPGNDAARLTAGESIVYDLTYISPISAASFDYSSVGGGGNGSYQAAAHIQRIGQNGDSGWIGPVPEPSTGLLVGVGLLVAARRRRRL